MVDYHATSTMFAALGDPRRALIVDLLAQRPRTASELAVELSHDAPISLQGTLKHVGVLERAGLVSRTKAGRTVTVHLEPANLDGAEAWLRHARTFWAAQLGRLTDHLEEHA